MNTTEKLMSNADRAFELLEQKSPHQLAVELAELQRKHDIAMSAMGKALDQRDQLVVQLKDATAQCVVSAELLRELREGAEIHLHNCTVCKNEEGIANWMSKLERIDATLAGKLPEPAVEVTETIRTAPAHIWLQVGDQAHYHSEPFPSDTGEVTWCADSVVGCEVPYVRADLAGQMPEPFIIAEGKLPELTYEDVNRLQMCGPIIRVNKPAVPEGWQLVPVEPTGDMFNAAHKAMIDATGIHQVYIAMLAAAPQAGRK